MSYFGVNATAASAGKYSWGKREMGQTTTPHFPLLQADGSHHFVFCHDFPHSLYDTYFPLYSRDFGIIL